MNKPNHLFLGKYRYCLNYTKPHQKSPQWVKDKHNAYLQEIVDYLSQRFDKKFERVENKIYTNDADTALWCKLMYFDNLYEAQIAQKK